MRTLLTTFVLAASVMAFAQDKTVAPKWKPVEGAEVAYKMELKFQAVGQDALFTGTAKSKVTKVGPDGSFEMENWMDGGKILIMGSEQEQPSEKTVTKYDKNGDPVEKRDYNSSIEEMLSAYTDVTLPAEGAKVGEKWKLTDKFDRIGKGEAEYLGTEDYQGKKCHAFKVTYAPKDGGSSDGKVFVVAETGLFAGFEVSFKTLQVAPGIESDGTASMKLVTN